MEKILCFALAISCFGFLGCQSKSQNDDAVAIPVADSTATPASSIEQAPAIAVGGIQPCAKRGSKINFNDQRIVAFQKLVQLHILRIKALPMTEESTNELSKVETLRRRVSYPLLTSSLRPQAVTKVLTREAKNFSVLLEKRRSQDSQAQSLYEEVNDIFLPLIANEDHWNCLEKQTDFQEDTENLEKTE